MKKLPKNLKGIFKIGDLILLSIFVVVIILTVCFSVQKNANTVEIYVDSKLTFTASLNETTEIEVLDGAMIVEIKDQKVWVKKSDCKNQICVHQKPLTSQGGIIVCLPNKVIVKVVNKEVDAVTQ